MAEITIYTVKNCPKCELLKSEMSYPGMAIADMSHPAAMATLRCHDIFTLAAPVLQVNDKFLTVDQIFKGDNLNIELLSQVLSDTLRDDVETACDRLRGEGWNDSADIVKRLYADNQRFQQDLKNLNELNYGLMGNCNSLRSQLNDANRKIKSRIKESFM